ncbi:uncharacterized protein [Palaemon carinicauda]|uniref:uncharacterized protein n=1 Tax=Palaemon carinicauda TaxID=392227 RepID=UPI0035B68B4B
MCVNVILLQKTTLNSHLDIHRRGTVDETIELQFPKHQTLVDLENQQKNYRTRKSFFDLTRSNSFERSYVTERSSKTLVDLENQQNYRTRNSSLDLTRSNSFERSYVAERSSKTLVDLENQ